MIELELDFAEEDVEFAHRGELKALVGEIREYVTKLMDTFELGNAIKNGVPTVIAGKPNTGKSTLLNTLLSEEKAIVSDIPGTTRDFIEDVIHIEGIAFRFIDTAGIREARDKIEAIGIERTRQKMHEAALIIYLFDLSQESREEIAGEVAKLDKLNIPYIKVGNKTDLAPDDLKEALLANYPDMVFISAKQEVNIDALRSRLTGSLHLRDVQAGEPIVTSLRHYEGLRQTKEALDDVIGGLDGGLTNDLVALDLRQALHHLGEITGEITTDDLLENIFSKFCIGK
jgi:tRNA modification GTPase